MKKAIIFFEGKEVCRVEFDGLNEYNGELSFTVDLKDVSFFPKGYGYAILDTDNEVVLNYPAILFTEKP